MAQLLRVCTGRLKSHGFETRGTAELDTNDSQLVENQFWLVGFLFPLAKVANKQKEID